MLTEAAREEASFLDGGSYPEEPCSLPNLSGRHRRPRGLGAKPLSVAHPFPVARRGQSIGLSPSRELI